MRDTGWRQEGRKKENNRILLLFPLCLGCTSSASAAAPQQGRGVPSTPNGHCRRFFFPPQQCHLAGWLEWRALLVLQFNYTIGCRIFCKTAWEFCHHKLCCFYQNINFKFLKSQIYKKPSFRMTATREFGIGYNTTAVLSRSVVSDSLQSHGL